MAWTEDCAGTEHYVNIWQYRCYNKIFNIECGDEYEWRATAEVGW
jgi:hypothetical protein